MSQIYPRAAGAAAGAPLAPRKPATQRKPKPPGGPIATGTLLAQNTADDDFAAAFSWDDDPLEPPPETWSRPVDDLNALAVAVQRGHGQTAVRRRLEDLTKSMSRAIYDPAPEEREKYEAITGRKVRSVVNADGTDIDWGAFERLRGDVALAQSGRAEGRQAAGVALVRSDGGYAVRTAAGGRAKALMLPHFMGAAIAADPAKYGPQLTLYREALGARDLEGFEDHARSIFATLHAREHNIVDGQLLYETADARAASFVTAARTFRDAKTPEAQAEADAQLRATLFAEAAPSNRLASVVLDILSPLGRANSAEEAIEDGEKAYRAAINGELGSAIGSGLWAIVGGIGAVGGVRYKAILKEVTKKTPQGRRLMAAYKLARFEANAAKKLEKVSGREMMGKEAWDRYDEDSQNFLQGILGNAKGIVGEEEMRELLHAADAKGSRGPGKLGAGTRDATKVEIKPEHGGGPGVGELGPRFYDELLEDQAMERYFGMFLLPAITPGTKTRIEVKTDRAKSRGEQAKKDRIIDKNKQEYQTHDLLLLRVPYNEISKHKIRDKALKMIRNPSGAGAEYLSGKKIERTINGKKVHVRTVTWTEEHLQRMMDDVDRALTSQIARGGPEPNVADFLTAVAARLAADAEEQIKK